MKPTGDCYEAALRFLWAMEDADDYRLCHGYPTGQGPIAGIVHGHAWVERTDPVPEGIPERFRQDVGFWTTCIDKSNGKDIELPRSLYYSIGNIDPDRVTYYTKDEACRLAFRWMHYGPWESELEGAEQ